MNIFARFAQDESGATAIEYGLIAALIFLVIVGGVTLLSGNVAGMFDRTAAAIAEAGAEGAP